MIGATAVLSRQVVTECDTILGDTGARNPATSVEGLDTGGFSSTVLSRFEGCVCVPLLHKVVWCFFLHFLHQNLNWHWDTL